VRLVCLLTPYKLRRLHHSTAYGIKDQPLRQKD